jgi:hypothetical protein
MDQKRLGGEGSAISSQEAKIQGNINNRPPLSNGPKIYSVGHHGSGGLYF